MADEIVALRLEARDDLVLTGELGVEPLHRRLRLAVAGMDPRHLGSQC